MKCEICNIPFKITEIRKPIYLWGITGVSKHDLKKFVTNMMMLIVAMTAMIGSIYLFCTTDRDRDHDELRDKNNEKSEFYGKIAILAFTVIGTVTFLILQIAWYRKFFEKLRRVNREIEVEIGENIKKKTLSTIYEEDEASVWSSQFRFKADRSYISHASVHSSRASLVFKDERSPTYEV